MTRRAISCIFPWIATTTRGSGTRYSWGACDQVPPDADHLSGRFAAKRLHAAPGGGTPAPEEMMDLPGMRDEMRRPMMLLVAASKGNI